jgi:pSer/pThr/pTyr-binding forkhead associated (FHA) protein
LIYSVSAILTITDPSGHVWEFGLEPDYTYTIGRARENDIVLNDRRVSRKHAHIVGENSEFTLVDGYVENGNLIRSVNKVFVNGEPKLDHQLEQDDKISIGETELAFRKVRSFNRQSIEELIASQPTNLASARIDLTDFDVAAPPVKTPSRPLTLKSEPTGSVGISLAPTGQVKEVVEPVKYDDSPLGQTQLKISAREIIAGGPPSSIESPIATPEEIRVLRRKAKMLELVYEMSRTLGTVFDLTEIFEKATDLIFRGTPADRAVALQRKGQHDAARASPERDPAEPPVAVAPVHAAVRGPCLSRSPDTRDSGRLRDHLGTRLAPSGCGGGGHRGA